MWSLVNPGISIHHSLGLERPLQRQAAPREDLLTALSLSVYGGKELSNSRGNHSSFLPMYPLRMLQESLALQARRFSAQPSRPGYAVLQVSVLIPIGNLYFITEYRSASSIEKLLFSRSLQQPQHFLCILSNNNNNNNKKRRSSGKMPFQNT